METNASKYARKLEDIVNTTTPLLLLITEDHFNLPAAPGKWSKKQILGHLADSATNNHHRFIRAQFEETPVISYNQDLWNHAGYYPELPAARLIDFWRSYNLQIAALVRVIPSPLMEKQCSSGETTLTLNQVLADYLRHLEHHLRQIAE